MNKNAQNTSSKTAAKDVYSTENNFSRGFSHFVAGAKKFVAGYNFILADNKLNKSINNLNFTSYGRTKIVSAK